MKICPKCGNQLNKFKGFDDVKWSVCIPCNHWEHRGDGIFLSLLPFIIAIIGIFIIVALVRTV